MQSSAPTTLLTCAVCVCEGATFSDFITPIEILYGINWADLPFAAPMGHVPYRLQVFCANSTQTTCSIMLRTPHSRTSTRTRTHTMHIRACASTHIPTHIYTNAKNAFIISFFNYFFLLFFSFPFLPFFSLIIGRYCCPNNVPSRRHVPCAYHQPYKDIH